MEKKSILLLGFGSGGEGATQHLYIRNDFLKKLPISENIGYIFLNLPIYLL